MVQPFLFGELPLSRRLEGRVYGGAGLSLAVALTGYLRYRVVPGNAEGSLFAWQSL